MPTFPSVILYKDSTATNLQPLDADTMNSPIQQLTERTDYLKAALDAVAGAGPFETIRVTNLPLDATDTPALYEVVYYNADSGKYCKALADVVASEVYPYKSATASALHVGILVAKTGYYGTVAFAGKTSLDSVALAAILETGETFRNGPYYVSTVEAGKLTAVPRGIAIYVGTFFSEASAPAYGDFAWLSPQFKDMYEAHLHSSHVLKGQPAGDTVYASSTWKVRGLLPDAYQPGGAKEGDPEPYRLIVKGAYTGDPSVTYTIWLSNAGTDIKDTMVHWSTDDHSDDTGGAVGLPITFYEREVPIGSKGLVVVLEMGGDAWSSADFSQVDVTDATWTVLVPERVLGWLPHWFRGTGVFSGTTAPAKDYVVQFFGGFTNTSVRSAEQLSIVVTANGDLGASPSGVTMEVYDIDSTLLATLADVEFDTAYDITGTGLWLVISRLTEAGIPAVDTAAITTDAWEWAFSDEAPQAKFEYAIEIDPVTAAYYPPAPVLDMVLEVNGVALDARGKFKTNEGSYLAGARTVFWFHDSTDEAPFSPQWVSLADPGPYYKAKNILLYSSYLRTAAAGLVTSIEAGTGVAVVDRNTGLPATSGDVRISAQFDVDTTTSDEAGALVVKSVSTDGKLRRGPVVEAIQGGAGVTVTSSITGGKGTVRISTDTTGLTYGDFEEIILLNAKQEIVPGRLTPYIKLLGWTSTLSNNVNSAFIGKFRVPYSLTSQYRVAVYATIFGLDDVNPADNSLHKRFAGFKFTYGVLPDYTNFAAPTTPAVVQRNLRVTGATGVLETQVWPATDIAVGCGGTIPGSTQGYTAYDPFVLHNDPNMTELDGQVLAPFMGLFPLASEDPAGVTAGNLVMVKFERASTHPSGSTPGTGHQSTSQEYTGALGIVSLKWKLIPV